MYCYSISLYTDCNLRRFPTLRLHQSLKMTCCVTWLTLLLLMCCDVEANPGPQKDNTTTRLSKLQTEFLEDDTNLIYSNPNFEEILVQKFRSSDSQIDFEDVPEFVDHQILAEFSSLAYENWDEQKTLELLPNGWELLSTAKNINILNGYFGIALWHQKNSHVVIAHRGTDIANSGSVFTDIWSVVLEKNGEQMNSACTFILQIKNQILKSNNKEIQLFITGHSLGGWLAQITTLIAKYFILENGKITLDKEEFNIQLIHPHTVVFESPGCKEMLLVIRKVYDVKYHQRKIDLKHFDITNYLTRPNAVNTCGRHIGTILTLCGNDLDIKYIHSIEDHGIVSIINKLKAKNTIVLNSKLTKRKKLTILDYILFIPRIILQTLIILFSWLFDIDYIPGNTYSEALHSEKCGDTQLYFVRQWPRLNYTDHLVSIYTDILQINDSTLENLNINVHVFDENTLYVNTFTKKEIYFLHVIKLILSLSQDKNLLQHLPTIFLQFEIRNDSVYCSNPRRFRSIVRWFVRREENVILQLLNSIMNDLEIHQVMSYVQNLWRDVKIPIFLKLRKTSTVTKIVKNTLNGLAEKTLLIITNHDIKLWSQILCSTFHVINIDHRIFLHLLPLFQIDKIAKEIKGKFIINFESLKNLDECLDIVSEIQYNLPQLSKYCLFLIKEKNTELKVKSNTVNIIENQNVHFGNIDEDSQIYILNCDINFQGKICKLRDLININIDDLEIHDIINNYYTLNVGKPLTKTEQFYFERNLIKQQKVLFKDVNGVLIKSPIDISMKREERENNIDDVIKTRVLISADSGEGKTTYLQHLALKIQEIYKFYWVVYLNLIDVQNIMLHKYDTNNKEANITFLYQCLGLKTKLEEYIFNHYLKITKRIILLFDGYDEIDPYFRDSISKLIDEISNENISQLFVTSSSSVVQYLQEKLTIHTLSTISKQNQLEYFTYYLNSKEMAEIALAALQRLQQDRLFEFCGVPLQMKMLSNIFIDNKNTYENLGQIQIFDMYTKFVDKLFEKYSGVNNITSSIIKYAHQLLAIKYSFPRLSIDDIDTLGILNKVDYEVINKIKIVHVSEDKTNIKFIHKTFATYLLSEFIANRLISLKEIKIHELEIVGNVIKNLEFINKIILIFTDPHYKEIRTFIDNFLKSMQDKIDTKISENIKLLINAILDAANSSYNLILHITGLENLLYVSKFATSFFTNAKLSNILNSTAIYDIEGNFVQSVNSSSPWQWIIPSVPIQKLNNQISTQIECTPFTLAAILGHVKIMQLLLPLLNSNIDMMSNNDGKTALHLAVLNKQKESVKFLLENNANGNITDLESNTPIHYAVNIEDVNIIKLLLDYKIDISIENNNGEKALDIAIKKGHELIIQEFVKYKNITQNKEIY